MKVELNVRDEFLGRPDAKDRMQEIITAIAGLFLILADETFYDIKIDGEDVSIY